LVTLLKVRDWLITTDRSRAVGRSSLKERENVMNGSTSARGKGNMIWGILMRICEFLAIALPFVSGIGVAIVIGWVLLATGVWHLLFGFRSGSGIGGFLSQRFVALV